MLAAYTRRNMVSTVAALQPQRYQNINQLVETASTHLSVDPPNYKHAWRAMLSAVEGLFGLRRVKSNSVYCPWCRVRMKNMRQHREPHERC